MFAIASVFLLPSGNQVNRPIFNIFHITDLEQMRELGSLRQISRGVIYQVIPINYDLRPINYDLRLINNNNNSVGTNNNNRP